MLTLEKRLTNLNGEVKGKLIESLLSEPINPIKIRSEMSYYKYNLSDYIAGELEKYETEIETYNSKKFSLNLESTINKEPLKRVQYGIKSTPEVPKEVLNKLTSWEKIYFFAGSWIKKTTFSQIRHYHKKSLKKQRVYETLVDTMVEGIKHLEKIHKDTYFSDINLPYKNNLFKAQRDINQKKQMEIYPKNNFEKLEEERVNALSRQDSENYAKLCIDLGINPEDKELYQQGLADLTLKQRKAN